MATLVLKLEGGGRQVRQKTHSERFKGSNLAQINVLSLPYLTYCKNVALIASLPTVNAGITPDWCYLKKTKQRMVCLITNIGQQDDERAKDR